MEDWVVDAEEELSFGRIENVMVVPRQLPDAFGIRKIENFKEQ